MASGHVNRANRPNTWLLRPMLHVKILLATRSRPHMAHRDILQRHTSTVANGA
jgi:hypothetical protein